MVFASLSFFVFLDIESSHKCGLSKVSVFDYDERAVNSYPAPFRNFFCALRYSNSFLRAQKGAGLPWKCSFRSKALYPIRSFKRAFEETSEPFVVSGKSNETPWCDLGDEPIFPSHVRSRPEREL